MNLPRRDVVATALVAVAGVLYSLWAIDSAPPGLESVRSIGVALLLLGFAASASAVVPGFDELLHGNRLYVVTTSVVGVIALAGGVLMLVSSSEFGLGVLMGAMVVLWLIATVHHWMLADSGASRAVSGFGRQHPRPA